ncbi:gp58-like family protein [Facklamia sp. 7083-14-GEN3]|uniref:gp58-like family protein n=1 Tax=Facklamia sp. 7083-14-GEN3 TaxID=2973478 RepID=UPI00215D5127|nr:gp58-like family protein [Facklamia sp. 7083-14-GEN3]MCR8969266.1 gp58-like family protein [Facklamia sp. 7083-14-GEN3]
MQITLNGQPLEIKQDGARKYVTFIPTSPDDKLAVDNGIYGNEICDINFTQTQLEKGETPTDFEDNSSEETLLSRLIEDAKEFAISTSGENTKNLIKLNSEGMLRRYIRDDGSSYYVAETSEGSVEITKDNNYFAEMVMGSDIFSSKIVSIDDFSTLLQQNSDSIQSVIKNSAGEIVNAINQSKDQTMIKASKIYLDGDVFAKKLSAQIANFIELSADKITSGTLNANNVNVVNLNANSIVSGTLSGINMRGGVLTALNSSTRFDLNSGALDFYTDYPAIRRIRTGYPNQFVQFGLDEVYSNDGTEIVEVASTAIGSNRLNNDVTTDGGFAGLRIFNSKKTPYVDRVQLIADLIEFTNTGDKAAYQNNIWMNLAKSKDEKTQLYPSYHKDKGEATLGRTGNTWSNLFTDEIMLNGVSLKAIINRLYRANGWGNIV